MSTIKKKQVVEKKDTFFSIRIENELLKEFKDKCSIEERAVSWMVKKLMRNWLEVK